MSAFQEQMTESILGHIDKYIDVISKKYTLPKKELADIWSGSHNIIEKINDKNKKIKKTVKKNLTETLEKSKPRKRNAYQTYFIEQQKIVKDKHPDLSFGECSSMISKAWNSMDKKTQEKYGDASLVNKKEEDISVTYLDSKSMPCNSRSEIETVRVKNNDAFLFEDEDDDHDDDDENNDLVQDSHIENGGDEYEDIMSSDDDNSV